MNQPNSTFNKLRLAIACLSIPYVSFTYALPMNGQVVVGQGQISTNGSSMVIDQNSSKLAINWDKFNIGSNESVTFNQPSANSVALNRILGNDPSAIYGRLNANGQVFLINPNGVLFGPNSQVEVGGLVASTLGLSNQDFSNDNYGFAGNSRALVKNQGQMQAGYVALIAERVRNSGSINTPEGFTALAAGQKVSLQLNNGSLLGFTIDQGALDALAENSGIITSAGGQTWLSAKAADQLSRAVVNNTGVIQATSLVNKNGKIMLMSDMNAGETHVAGTLDASASGNADGGFIETSAAKVKVQDGTVISTLANNGNTGTWLIDPQDFHIGGEDADMSAATLESQLGSNHVTIVSSSGNNSGSGDINVHEDISWSAHTLTLTASHSINIYAKLGLTGSAGLELNTNTANGGEAASTNGVVNILPGFGRVSLGSGTSLSINNQSYTILTDLTGLQGINGSGYYALGGDITAGGFISISTFDGVLNGLGNSIDGLTISDTGSTGLFSTLGSNAEVSNLIFTNAHVAGGNYVGTVAGVNNGTIFNVVTDNQSQVTGSMFVGGLVGENNGEIFNVQNNAEVTGQLFLGGIAGQNKKNISTASNSGTITKIASLQGSSIVGGIAGLNDATGSIKNSYSDGAVGDTDASLVGGIAGRNDGDINYTFNTGSVTGAAAVGGIAGSNFNSIDNSLYESSTAAAGVGTGSTSGVSAKTTAELKQQATYSGWDSAIWRFYDGRHVPLLKNTLKPVRIELAANPYTYKGEDYKSGDFITDSTIAGNVSWDAGIRNVGTYDLEEYLYPTNFNYDLIYINGSSVDIDPYVLTVTATTHSKVYDGTKAAELTNVSLNSFAGDDVSLVSTDASFADKNAGTGKAITLDSLTLTGSSASNYRVTQLTATDEITPKDISLKDAQAKDKIYDGNDVAALTYNGFDGVISGDNISLNSGYSSLFNNKNAGTNKAVTVTGLSLTGADAANYNLQAPTGLTASIAKKELTVTGTQTTNRVYDGTTDVTLSGAQLAGVIAGETVNLLNSSQGQMADKNAGNNKIVTTNMALDANDADAINYTLKQPENLKVNISKASITLNGVQANNKTYDGTNAAEVTYTGFTGTVAGDDLQVNGSDAVFQSKNVGTHIVTAKPVLSGADADNYQIDTLTSPIWAGITPADIYIGIKDVTKTYDATTSAKGEIIALNGTQLFGNDKFENGSFVFDNENAGTGKTVSVSGVTINDGNGGNNYTIKALVDNTNSTILKKTVTLTANSQTVFFDGTTHSLTGYALEGVVKPEHEALFGIVDAPVSGERIGLYTHNVTGTGTENYELIIVNGALRIRPAGASVLSGTDFENGYNAAWVTSVATHKLLEQERVQSQKTRAEVHNIISVPTRQSYLSLPLDPMQQAERLVSTIPAQLFTSPFNTSTLQYEAELKQRLTPLARYLSHNKHIAVVITGFTDDSGKVWYNESLSLQRADNVAQILEDLGVDQRQLYSQGQGAANPRATNDTLEGRNLNRRVEMKFIDTRTNKPV